MVRTRQSRVATHESAPPARTTRTRASSRAKSRPTSPSSARGSSRRPGASAPPLSDSEALRFTSHANAQWCAARKSNSLVVEKSVSAPIDSLFHLTDAFDSIGWRGVLQLSGAYFPQLVLEFYANIEGKDNPVTQTVTSYVKGRRIHLTRAILASILEVHDEGPDFLMVKDRVPADPHFRLHEAADRLACWPILRPSKDPSKYQASVYSTTTLPIRQRELVYLYSANVLPRASSLNEVRLADIYFLDKMLHGLQGLPGLPLASIILSQIRQTVRLHRPDKSLPYPLLLTKVFEHFEVDLSGEDVRMTKNADEITEATLRRHQFVKVRGVWTQPGSFSTAYTAAFSEIPEPAAGQSEMPPLLGIEGPPSSDFSIQESLQRLEAMCAGLVTRQTTMETQLQQQSEQLQRIWDAVDPSTRPSP